MAYQNPVRPVRVRRALDAVLLGGVSALALMLGSQPSEARSAQNALGSVAATVAAQQAAAAAAAQAAAAASQAQSSLARAAQALAAAQRLQATAAALGGSSTVPNGLTTGGLVPTDVTNTSLWTGANAPVQSTSGSQVTVDIQQTAAKALLYWNSFNVGSNTTVNFEQANSNYIALNRVNNSTAPSQVFGKINALGAVYIINSNGIIFGAGSQVNVNTLVASSLDIGPLGSTLTQRDSYFRNTGIANLNSFSFYDWGTQGSATSNAVAGDVTVQRGAQINANIATDLSPQGAAGDIYLFGANVYNSGWLNAPTGEIAMVAARTIDLVPNGYTILPSSIATAGTTGDRLTEFTVSPFSSSYTTTGSLLGYPLDPHYLSGTGTVYHDGLIEASRGAVIMDGNTVTIGNPTDAAGNPLTDAATGSLVQGVISVDTSLERNSFVLLSAATSVTMNGVITSLPYDDGSSLPTGGSSGSTVQNFVPAFIEMNAQTSVTMGSNGLISAPSADVSLRAMNLSTDSALYLPLGTFVSSYQYQLFNQGGSGATASSSLNAPLTVELAPGAIIDVAGLENVTLPAGYNFISVSPRNEFANMPVQRNGVLYGESLWIDIRTGTPLADVSGDIANVGRSIYQMMTTGGSVKLQTDLTPDGASTVKTAGSVINVAGGNVNFLPGFVPTTLLLGADGRIYNMANANPNMVYVGVANQFTVDHSRWGITETWSTQTYSPGYSQGSAAGNVSVTTDIAALQQGTIYFGSVAGAYQIADGQLPSQGSFSLTTPSNVQIGSSASSDYTAEGPVTVLSDQTLSNYGLSALSITSNDLVVSSGSTLNLAPGGSFSAVTGGAIDIAGTITAAGGAVSLDVDRIRAAEIFNAGSIGGLLKLPTDSAGNVLAANVYVEGTIDVSGRFVNDTGRTGSDLAGPADINGGSISITTNKVSGSQPGVIGTVDESGSILLAQGSVLDVSSGGYLNSQGNPKTSSSAVNAGSAGSISLLLYGGYWAEPDATPQPTQGSVSAFLELDGSLLGYGFQSNGSLTIRGVDSVVIGGSLANGGTSSIHIGGVPAVLPVSLFTNGGFGSYTIESTEDGWSGATSSVTVSAGVDLSLQQQNLVSSVGYNQVATGTKLGQQTSPALALLPADQRQPVNLTLMADNILLDKGSIIATDPGAGITIGNLTLDPIVSPSLSLPATTVDLRGSIIDHGGSVFINASATHLESGALVDLSGTFIANSTFGLRGGALTSGTYLPGGSFTVEAAIFTQTTEGSPTAGTAITVDGYSPFSFNNNQIVLNPLYSSSYLVADAGAKVDVSGAAGNIQVAGVRGTTSSVWSWSDAGTVTADVAGFAWGGSFAAMGGRYVGADGNTHADPRANNGTIILGGGSIVLSQDITDVQAVLASGAPPNMLHVAASQLESFDNVYLYAAAAEGGADRIFTDRNGNIFGYAPPIFGSLVVDGSVALDVSSRLHIAAGNIAPISTSSINAQFTAPYIELTGGGGGTSAGSSTLTINAQTIDVEGAAFSGFSQVNLISAGDIRLGTIKVADGYIPTTASTLPAPDADSFTGSLTSSGNLLFSAQRIYPLTAVTFTIQTPGDVQFTAPAGSDTSIPLAAAGGIDVIATNIDQAGNLFAPLGQITLGNTSTAVSSIITQSVTLEPGSLTSVSLADTTVPYGATLDGTNWYYNASLDPLSGPPSKGLTLAGSNVSVTQGSTIDLRGGGDLQAMEWISGKGGTVDTLETTSSGPTVYALVPSINAAVAAYDIQFATSRSFDNGTTVTAGDVNPLVGSQITIAGGGGIAAGTYTLYPAHYATLPGAMKVTVYQNSNLGRNIPSGTTLTDGTVLITGNFTQSTGAGKQSAGQTVFAVQTNAVWQSYSEYQFSSANSYFRNLAAKNGTIIPVPIDAGSLQAIALQSINLSGSVQAQPGQDSSGNIGSGSELDISSPQMIDVVGHAQYVAGDVPTGYLGIDVSQLDTSGFGSILIGGLRSNTASGTLITPASAGILVDTRGEAFTAPEILLVATPEMDTTSAVPTPVANTGNVTIAAGSVIDTTGTVNQAAGRNYYFGAMPGAAAQNLATALGGKLDSTGTVITGATGTLASASAAVQSYLQNTTGSLFVATNDATLNASGPTGTPITVQFASGGSAVVAADAGKVTVQSGTSITTKTLSLQAAASTNAIAINTNDLHVRQLNLTARTIALGSTVPPTDVSLSLANSQFALADVGGLALKALSGAITIDGDFNPGATVTSLSLDAGALVQGSGSGDAVISDSGTITLLNSGAATALTSPASGQSTLGFNALNIVLGSGTLTSAQTILGYDNVNFNAGQSVVIAGSGSLTLGTASDAVNLSVKTPLVLVAGASGANDGAFTVSTGGNLSVMDTVAQSGWGAQPADSSEAGGSLALTAASINVGTVIQAQAGTITLEATAGDVTLLPRADLDAGGYAKTLVDVTTYMSGGKVVLKSDAGNVNAGAFSIIDVAQPSGGLGYGGELDVTALNGSATFAGLMYGSGGPGLGGTFNLNIKGAADLGHVDPATGVYQPGLADQLLFGGFTGSINIETRTGNIILAQGHTLKANSITLTADDSTWNPNDPTQQFGQVQIYGELDASGYGGTTLDGSGEAGGQVALYGANSVLLASTSVIDASTTHADQRGGDVTIGIGWSAQSKIYLQAFMQIDVSGGTAGGLSGGTVTFIAPTDGNNDMKIAGLEPGSTVETSTLGGTINGRNAINISGARSVTFDDYVAFDTTTSNSGINGSSLGWNGTIDPAGWYTSNGSLATTGSWTNVAGWQISSISGSGFVSVPVGPVAVTGGNGSGATLTNFVMGVGGFIGAPTSGLPKSSTILVTFPGSPADQQAAGYVAATGTVQTDANGNLLTNTFTVTTPGRGYTTPPQSATLCGATCSVSIGSVNVGTNPFSPPSTLAIVSAQVGSLGSGYAAGSSTTFSVFVVGTRGAAATVTFTEVTNGSGTYADTNGTIAFTPNQNNFIPFQSSGVFSAFNPATQNTTTPSGLSVATFTGNTQDQTFFGTTLAQITQGTWSYNGQNYGFSNLFNRLQPLVTQLGASVVQVQPGVQLVNSTGSITVANNWNLASGTAGNLQTAANSSVQYFDPASSFVSFNYRLVTPWGNVDAGDLTLRAAGNINIDASISDGFFQFGNYLDPSYVASVNGYVIDQNSTSGGNTRTFANDYNYYLNGVGTVPIAPYKSSGNAISPTSQDLAASDLFPNSLNVCTGSCTTSNPTLTTVTALSSWSYTFTAGADFASANPTARIALTGANAANNGDVIVNNHTSYVQSVIADSSSQKQATQVVVDLPTMVRTGTGDITIAAARDVVMADTTAPGVIYAAGVNTPLLPGANYSGSSSVIAGNPDGFLEPQLLAYGNNGTVVGSSVQTGVLPYYGPPTAAAFPEMGGDVTVDAQRDVVGYSGSGNKVLQYYQPWLLADSGVTSGTALFGAGVFAPVGSQIGSQTAWWIQYSSFQQGILSAGGNVTVVAGRDLLDVSVSLPTTGRVSGGLSATDTPVTHLYGSGNMVVRAGQDILGGSFYEGSGFATIMARGTIGQNGTVSRYATSTLQIPDLPLLAVDTGKIEMVALGSLTVAGVINPAELQSQRPTAANPLDNPSSLQDLLYVDTYGPDSGANLVAATGNLTISIAPTAFTDGSSNNYPLTAVPGTYPASLQALAPNGSLITTGIQTAVQNSLVSIPMPGIVLSPSDHGSFELLAQDSVDLTFGFPDNTQLLAKTPRPYISAGSALINTGFDPFQPNDGFDGASSGVLLAHADDAQAGIDATARIYAVSGSIKATGNYGHSTASDTANSYQIIQINRPAEIYAGTNITDLNIIIQNIHPSDVSTITAGGNISYTGFNNGGGMQVAGPGFLVVQAGGDIGPFLPTDVDSPAQAKVQEGIASVGNASATVVGDIYLSKYSVGIYDQTLFGPVSNPRRNSELPAVAGTSQGADVIVLFGVKSEPDYQAMINAYINPAAAGGGQNYALNVDGLQAYLAQLGYQTSDPQSALTIFQQLSPSLQLAFINGVFSGQDYLQAPGDHATTDPQTAWAIFQMLPANLQHVLADQVFFAELKNVGKDSPTATNCPQVCQPAWTAINTLFPSGHTIGTSELDLLHATIQTRLGGSVSIMGPGGNITVGSLAAEPNPDLRLRDLGILTLGGGDIDTYTDGSVLVNSSRILTTQGGDILMWSSFGDLNAGRGSKTIVSAPALQVQYDQNDYGTIDPGGFVTGSGIGTLQASSTAAVSNVYLVAPNGTIDFGTAGVRSSGTLVVVAPVVANSSNATFATSNIVPTVNIAGLTSGSNTAGAAAKSADTATATGPSDRDQASVFIVEVIGYGGGDNSSAPTDDSKKSQSP